TSCRRAPARSTTPMPRRRTSTRSSSGRRRRRTAATARATAWTTRSGSKPGLTSRVELTTQAYEAGRSLTAARRRLSAALWRRPWLRAIALLVPPLGWMVVFYLAALTVLFVLVLLPLWSSYLARIYAWRLILNHDGALNWSLAKVGLPQQGWAFTNTAMWIVFSYIWLPFMILPVYAALERIPDSYLEASRDLGAGGLATLRREIA